MGWWEAGKGQDGPVRWGRGYLLILYFPLHLLFFPQGTGADGMETQRQEQSKKWKVKIMRKDSTVILQWL